MIGELEFDHIDGHASVNSLDLFDLCCSGGWVVVLVWDLLQCWLGTQFVTDADK